jgi:hypothetical protein
MSTLMNYKLRFEEDQAKARKFIARHKIMLLINFQQMLINSNNRNGIKLLAEVLVKIQFLYNTLDDVEMDKSLLMRSVSDPSNTFDFLSQLFRLAEQQ